MTLHKIPNEAKAYSFKIAGLAQQERTKLISQFLAVMMVVSKSARQKAEVSVVFLDFKILIIMFYIGVWWCPNKFWLAGLETI